MKRSGRRIYTLLAALSAATLLALPVAAPAAIPEASHYKLLEDGQVVADPR